MKLHEMVAEPEVRPITDPCRLLTPYRDLGTVRFPDIRPPGRDYHYILVADDETGLVTKQILHRDGHLGAVSDDC